MFKIIHKGDFEKTTKFLTSAATASYLEGLERYGQEGIDALVSMTPVDSGNTAACWSYEVYKNKGVFSIKWSNSNMVGGVPVVILLQYGHGTRNGGYVQGRDFINPAIKPIFDKIAEQAWKGVTNL